MLRPDFPFSHEVPRVLTLGAVFAVLVLAGCASGPGAPAPGGTGARPGPAPRVPSATADPSRDGPEAVIPPNLDQVPDAEPRLEPIRKGGPNKPYEVFGQRYEPVAADEPLIERGLASWYGRKFHGRPTSSGEVYNMYAMTGAHPTMPIPSYARVRNPANGREVIVRINDRGPFHPGRIIDLSYTAALKLDTLRGVVPVEVERITFEDIRTGAWRRENPPPVYLASEASGAPERKQGTPVQAEPSAARPSEPVMLASAAPNPAPNAVAEASPTQPPVNEAPLPPAPRNASPGFWLQLGAFSRLDGAEQLRQQLLKAVDHMAPLLTIFKDQQLHRLQAGPYATREQARQAAQGLLEAARVKAIVVQRR